jgi:hypothetical protein
MENMTHTYKILVRQSKKRKSPGRHTDTSLILKWILKKWYIQTGFNQLRIAVWLI